MRICNGAFCVFPKLKSGGRRQQNQGIRKFLLFRPPNSPRLRKSKNPPSSFLFPLSPASAAPSRHQRESLINLPTKVTNGGGKGNFKKVWLFFRGGGGGLGNTSEWAESRWGFKLKDLWFSHVPSFLFSLLPFSLSWVSPMGVSIRVWKKRKKKTFKIAWRKKLIFL